MEDDVALAGADGRGVAADGKREGRILEDIAEGAALPVAEIAAGSGVGATGVGAGEGCEVGAGLELGGEEIGLGLGAIDLGLGGVLRGGDEDLAEVNLLGDHEVLLVGVVVSHFVGVGHVEMAADLIADDLLADELVADVLLEVFKGDALLSGGLLEGLHGGEVVLLADVVELAHGLGVGGDAELLALGEQELLVDHVAEQVVDAVVELGLGEVVLVGFLEELLLGGLRTRCG